MTSHAAMPSQDRPPLPGEVLRARFLQPRQMPIKALANQIGITRKHLSNIVHGWVRVTPHVAVRLARVLDTTPALWINLQSAVDLHEAEQEFNQTAPSLQ